MVLKLWQSEDSVHCSHCPFEDLRFPPSPLPAAPLKDFMCKERGKKKKKGKEEKK